MPHVMVVVDLFILVAIIWAFSENAQKMATKINRSTMTMTCGMLVSLQVLHVSPGLKVRSWG
jgi:hypothetical protein